MFPGDGDPAAAGGGLALLPRRRQPHAHRPGAPQAEDRPQGKAQARVQALQRAQEQVSQWAKYLQGVI